MWKRNTKFDKLLLHKSSVAATGAAYAGWLTACACQSLLALGRAWSMCKGKRRAIEQTCRIRWLCEAELLLQLRR